MTNVLVLYHFSTHLTEGERRAELGEAERERECLKEKDEERERGRKIDRRVTVQNT